MKTFFSGTDMNALHDGAESLDILLSIIVNRHGNKIAKIAMITEVEKKVLFKHQKKKFFFKTEPVEVLSILDCRVEIENEGKFGKEIEAIIVRKRKEKEQQQAKNTVSSQYKGGGGQLQLFDKDKLIKQMKDRGEEVDNEANLTDKAIRNLIVRSLAYDDLVEGTIRDTIKIIVDMSHEFNMREEVKNMVSHFLNTLQIEYYHDQFGYVIERVVSILGEFRDDADFVHQFCNAIEYWYDEYIDEDGSLDNGKLDIGESFKSVSRELADRSTGASKAFITQKEFTDEF